MSPDFLGDFRGLLQVDAYSGYDAVLLQNRIVAVGCWAHARRRFFKALDGDKTNAAAALAMIGRLYEVEREAKNHGLDPDGRRALRQRVSKAVLDELRSISGPGAAVIAGYVLLTRAPMERRSASAFVPAGILFGLSYVCLFEAYYRGPVTVVSPLVATESLWGVALSALVLARSEKVGVRLVAGACLVVAGGVLIGVFR